MSIVIESFAGKLCLEVGHGKMRGTGAFINGIVSHATMLSLSFLMVYPSPL